MVRGMKIDIGCSVPLDMGSLKLRYATVTMPQCAISTDSIETSFLEASNSGPSHLQMKHFVNVHFTSLPPGPICVIVSVKRDEAMGDESSFMNFFRSSHSENGGP